MTTDSEVELSSTQCFFSVTLMCQVECFALSTGLLLLGVGCVDLRLEGVCVWHVLLLSHVLEIDVVAVADLLVVTGVGTVNATVGGSVAEVDVGLSVSAVLRDSKSLLVGLVIGASNNLLIEVGDLVRGTISVGVLTKDDSLTEHLVVSG